MGSVAVRLAAPLLVALVAAGACAPSDPSVSLEDAVYVEAGHLPDGWTVGWATQRTDSVETSGRSAIDFSDYTLVWVPADRAGSTRDDALSGAARRTIFVNSGSRYYEDVYWPAFGTDVTAIAAYDETTPLELEEDLINLSFRVECCIVRLSGLGVTEDELRRVAASLTSVDESDWSDELGNRLLIDGAEA